MTAYEFTRFEADRTYLLKAKGYDIDVIAMKIDLANLSRNCFRDTVEYANAQDVFYDLTMSCNDKEALRWLGHWMLNAIAYASQTKDLDWRIFFIAAYDIYNSILRHRKNQAM